MKKWHWNSVVGLEVTMDFFMSGVISLSIEGEEGGACSVNIFCGVASLEGMSRSDLVGNVFAGCTLGRPVFPT